MNEFIGTGWAFPPMVGPTGSIATLGGHALLDQAIRLILVTYPGERPMRPLFGSTLRDHVFAGADAQSFARIGAVVREAVGQWEPRVEVTEVRVYPDEDQPGLLYIDINYTVPETNSPRNLVFPFYTIPQTQEEP